MNLLGRTVGLDQPLFLIAGPCVVESEELQLWTAERLKAITDKLGIHLHLQVQLRQGQPHSGKSYPRARHGGGPARPRKGAARSWACRCSPMFTTIHADRRGRRGRGRAPDAGLPGRQTDFIHAVAPVGQAGEHQEGRSSWRLRDMKNVVDKARGAAKRPASGRDNHGLRARRLVRLQQSRQRHALARDHARDRLPGGVRRDPLACSCPAGRGRAPAGSANSCQCLPRAAVATGIAGLFMETHPGPGQAPSRTGRTRGRSTGWRACSQPSLSSTDVVKQRGFEEANL